MSIGNAFLAFWASCTPGKRDPDADKPRGFVARHPAISLAIIATFGYAVVKLTLLSLR